MPPPEQPLHRQLRALEEELLQPETRASSERLRELLADEFLEFGSSGTVYDRQAIISTLSAEPQARLELSEFNLLVLGPGLVLATYRTTRTAPVGAPVSALRSSLWKLRDGRWKMVFHQGTPTSGS